MNDPRVLPPVRRPNVLWIFGDQHRAQATGYCGGPKVSIPNLDNLGPAGAAQPSKVRLVRLIDTRPAVQRTLQRDNQDKSILRGARDRDSEA